MANSVKFAGNDMELLGTQIKVGDVAPDFSGVGKDLHPIKLSDYEGKVRILSVFPSIDTAICSMQAAKFNQQADALGADVSILAVSVDLPFALGRYCGAEGIENLTVVSDHRELDFGMKYGFVLPGLRLLARGVVVVDKAGVVRYVEYVPEVTTEPDYDRAIEAVKALL